MLATTMEVPVSRTDDEADAAFRVFPRATRSEHLLLEPEIDYIVPRTDQRRQPQYGDNTRKYRTTPPEEIILASRKAAEPS